MYPVDLAAVFFDNKERNEHMELEDNFYDYYIDPDQETHCPRCGEMVDWFDEDDDGEHRTCYCDNCGYSWRQKRA